MQKLSHTQKHRHSKLLHKISLFLRVKILLFSFAGFLSPRWWWGFLLLGSHHNWLQISAKVISLFSLPFLSVLVPTSRSCVVMVIAVYPCGICELCEFECFVVGQMTPVSDMTAKRGGW